MKAKDMERVAELIDRALRSESERGAVRRVREDVAEFLEAFPVYEELSQEWA
jgi:glycine/serine hydroxymethyltransferase